MLGTHLRHTSHGALGIERLRSDAVLPTVEALKADKIGQIEYYLMLKTYHFISVPK